FDAVGLLFGSAAMDLMTCSFEGDQSGLCQDLLKAPRLTREMNKLFFCPRHDDDRHLELVIPLCESGGRGRHRNCIFSACFELRWSQRQLGRKFGLKTRRYGGRRKKLSEHSRSHGTSKQWRDRVAQQIA